MGGRRGITALAPVLDHPWKVPLYHFLGGVILAMKIHQPAAIGEIPALVEYVSAEAVDAVLSRESGLAFTKAQADPGLVGTDDASLARLSG
jgi:hypothetical protein